MLCWDEKYFYIEQRFEHNGNLVAVGVIKGLLRGRTGSISPTEVLGSINVTMPSPEIPAAIQLWQRPEELAALYPPPVFGKAGGAADSVTSQ